MSRRLIVQLATKGALAQLLGLITYALIASTLDAVELGRYTLFLSTGTILVGFGSVKIGQAVLASESEDDALELTIAAKVVGGIAALVVIVCMLIAVRVQSLSYLFSLYPSGTSVLFPCVVFLGASITGVLAFCERLAQIHEAANIRLLGAASFVVGIGLSKALIEQPSSLTMAICYVTSLAVQLIVGILILRVHNLPTLSRSILLNHLWLKSLKKYRKYMAYGLPTSWINTLSLESPVIAISYVYGSIPAAYYGLARKLFTSAAPVFNSSISKYYYSKAIGIKRSMIGDLGPITSRLLKRSTLLLYLFLGLAISFSLTISTWKEGDLSGAIPFTLMMAVPLAMWTQSQPLTCLYLIKSVPQKQLTWNIQNLTFSLVGFFVCSTILRSGVLLSVGIMSIAHAYMYFRKIQSLSGMVNVDRATIRQYCYHIIVSYLLCCAAFVMIKTDYVLKCFDLSRLFLLISNSMTDC